MPFDSKKIIRSITRAAQDAELTLEEINKIVNEVSTTVINFVQDRDKIQSSEIREMILSELDSFEPKVSIEWRRFMSSK